MLKACRCILVQCFKFNPRKSTSALLIHASKCLLYTFVLGNRFIQRILSLITFDSVIGSAL